jgi:hypothetical protein
MKQQSEEEPSVQPLFWFEPEDNDENEDGEDQGSSA